MTQTKLTLQSALSDWRKQPRKLRRELLNAGKREASRFWQYPKHKAARIAAIRLLFVAQGESK